ncbi:hypothetical protein Pla123a_04260 [Posidoniimonas polymericola]|uniref:AsmA-like C-terminal domain-containing protein n=1 Tax=Posidoniimonas polymericola TaxID=2528002 RepID=A0A5C5ZDW9_9BACT|nr:hypothetical protein [Posidoniimonas polymericola]TWT85619.1 hypothetical protein Pla123a_04260 [Posidoniimonas polymericola]
MLHQSTKRRLCRALFLLACLLPTFAVTGVIAWRLRPDYSHKQLADLAAGLGVRVECGQCYTPRPGERRFADLRVLHPETGALIATLDTLRCAGTDEGVVGVAGVLTIEVGKLADAGRVLCDSLRGVTAGVASITFAEVRCGNQLLAADARLTSESPVADRRVWSLAEEAADGRRFQLVRNRQLDPPTTRLTLETGAAPLAWGRLAGLTPLPAALGPAATFAGKLTLDLEANHGQLQGGFNGVDLAAFTPPESGLHTHVPARLYGVDLAWQAGRFERLDLCVEAAAGEAAWPFADLARYQLRCVLTGPMLTAVEENIRLQAYPNTPLAFDALAFRLRLDGAGCRVLGLLSPSAGFDQNCVMQRQGQTMLVADGEHAQPLDALLPLVQTPGVGSPYACPRAVELLAKLPTQDPTNAPALQR